MLFELAVYDHFKRRVDNDKGRNTKQHAPEAENSAKDNDGKQHPEAVYADGGSEYLRADNVAVKLLEDKHEDDKPQAHFRIDQQYQQSRGDRADKRAEERDDVRNADYDRNKQRIRHFKYHAADIAQHADYRTVEQLAAYKAHERFVGKAKSRHDALCARRGKDAVKYLSVVGYERLLIIKYINRNDDADNDIIKSLEDVENAACYVRYHALHARQQRVRRPFCQRIGQVSENLRCVLLDLGIVLEEIINRRIRRVKIRRAVCYDGRYAVVNLRNYEIEQRGNKQQHDDLGKDEREHARKLCACFKARLCFVYAQNKRLKKLPLVKRHRRDEKIRYHKTPYKRA